MFMCCKFKMSYIRYNLRQMMKKNIISDGESSSVITESVSSCSFNNSVSSNNNSDNHNHNKVKRKKISSSSQVSSDSVSSASVSLPVPDEVNQLLNQFFSKK